LNLWTYLRRERKELSGSRFRRMCRDEFLHFMRVREWQDVHAQLRQAVKDLGLDVNADPADPDRVHESLLSGLLSHVGLRDTDGREYVGARQARFAIFPGSALAKKPPRWVMAAELVETSRLWARTAARVDPAWIEALAGHLVRRSHSEPHWSKKRAAVMAYERVTLYGIPLVTDRLVTYGRIDPEVSRELFIRHALVQGEWGTRHAFFAANRRLLEDVENLEERVRRRDIRVDDETLFDFYDRRVGAEVVSGRHFDSWWKKVRRQQPGLLDLTPEDLTRDDAGAVSEEEYPTEWHSGDVHLPLSYSFDPGAAVDGLSVDVPLERLADVDSSEFAWHVPGHRLELVTALIRSLPKAWRRRLVPAPEYARQLLDLPLDHRIPLVDAVVDGVRRMTGDLLPPEAFDLEQLPPHLRVTFRVHDGDETVATGKDLEALRTQLRPRLRAALTSITAGLERDGLTGWDLGELPAEVETVSHGHTVTGYPALVDRGDSVAVRVLESAPQRDVAMRHGLRRLLLLTVGSPLPNVVKDLPNQTKLLLAGGPHASVLDALEDCLACAMDEAVRGEQVRDEAAFLRLRERVRADVHGLTVAVAHETGRALDAAAQLRGALDDAPADRRPVVDDIGVQLSWLVYPGFVAETGLEQLRHLPRYLRAAQLRLAAVDSGADSAAMAQVQDLEAQFYETVQALPEHERETAPVRRARWSLEELRVGLFAQRLRTAYPVSVKRVRKQLDALERG
ncbi:MAG: ATP-dependent RNA helicase HrpA, partial [Nocardioidaceae bacterium]